MSTFERRNYSDQLNIETPEHVELQFHVAGIGSRFVAVLLDHLIQYFSMGLLIFVLVMMLSGSRKIAGMFGGDDFSTSGKWALAAAIFVFFLLDWGYFALFEAYWRGQTPGKKIMKLRVIKDAGRQITLFEALARNLLRYVDRFPGMYLIGVITMLCNKQNKRLGDLVAGTLVIHEAREEQPLFYQGSYSFLAPQQVTFDSVASTVPAMFPADAIAKLKPSDLQLIDTFFGRALDLSMETRAAMALRVANGMAAKMGVLLPEGNPERALESIAVQMRGSGRAF